MSNKTEYSLIYFCTESLGMKLFLSEKRIQIEQQKVTAIIKRYESILKSKKI